MTRKLASKEKERIQTRCLILKTLLGLGEASKQKLHEELKERIHARATLSKRVNELAEENIIRIEKGPRGPVGTHNCNLKIKGLAYLLLECTLDDEDLEKTLTKLLHSEKLKELRFFAHIVGPLDIAQVLTRSLSELRSKINLEYFDEEWFEVLLTEIFEIAFLERFLGMPKHKQARLGKEAQKSIRRAIMKRPRIKKDVLAWCDSKIKNAQVVKKQKKREIQIFQGVSIFFRNLR